MASCRGLMMTTYSWVDGDNIFVGQWKADQYHGHGVLTTYSDGAKYEGEFKDGEFKERSWRHDVFQW